MSDAGGPARQERLYVYNGGFLTQNRVKRILDLAGYKVSLGAPSDGAAVGVWGKSPTAHRGQRVADRTDAPLIRVEDPFLRSVLTGRSGSDPLGLLIDKSGVHFDPATPSDLETLLRKHPLDDTALLDRARDGIERLKEAHLTKYTGFDPDHPAPEPGYVLVIDQTRDDASVTASKADRNRFLEMLFVAQEEHPGVRILIKSHPETLLGQRAGHFERGDASDRVGFVDAPVSPWHLLEGAVAVFTVSSQLGFEAVMAGHKPRVFGQPFYASWGLTADEIPVDRRQRRLTRAQLFAGAMIEYPTWYDPYRDSLCSFEEALETLAAETRAWREDHRGWVAGDMRLWKRKHMQDFFGAHKKVIFGTADRPVDDRKRMIWAGGEDRSGAVQVEDGFLRSRGLGAELVPPLSLVLDDLGIYYDPARPSRLEDWIAKRHNLRPDQRRRARKLIRTLIEGNLSKYNLGGALPHMPLGQRVLVVGQVEDDASVRLGAGEIQTNEALLKRARTERPDGFLIYKPHPDVEAGLRNGACNSESLADVVARRSDIAALLAEVDEVWSMTSLTGFEALLRGKSVYVTGAPFYAGWGLTNDLGDVPPRRRQNVSLEGLVHATLIDYPRYFDPVMGQPCPVEVVVERLAEADMPRTGPVNRALSKLQGLFASVSYLWR
ncbi:MAG: capsular polysaccharide biosynthesis protein [Pseudomonadota bacterium]